MRMNKISLFLVYFLSIELVKCEDRIFMDQASKRKSRSQLKKEYERCKNRINADIPSRNKIENFDITGLRHRSRFSSIDSGENSKAKLNVDLWPKGEIPAKLEPGFTKREITSLKCAILYFHAHTCLTFLTKNKSHTDYIYLMKTHKRGGCFTDIIGKKGGRQILNLDPADDHCWEHGTIIHEIMHVLGFFHEHSRSDRDKYLVVHWNNIPKSLYFQFWTTTDMGYEHKDVGKYDYGSVMHYSRYFGFDLALSAKLFSDQYEQQAKDNDAMGQRLEPSDEDTNKIYLMYCPHLAKSVLDCKDELDCSGFASGCQSSEFVRKKCRNTCNLCNQVTTSSSTANTPTSSPTIGCINERENCARNLPVCRSSKTAHFGDMSIMINKSTTIGDKECIKWSLHPKFSLTVGDHNYCRNPNNAAGLWCYIKYIDATHYKWNFCYFTCA